MANYKTRKQAAKACKDAANLARYYSEATINSANAGACKAAWNHADNARLAAGSAARAHDELWNLAKGQLTDEEFAAFEAAEIAQADATKAERAAAAAVEKLNA